MSKYGVNLTVVLTCLSLSLLSGCRGASPQQQKYIAMLDAEKRSLEDIIYRQEAEYEMAIKQLKKCRTERDANKIDSGDNGMPAVEIPAVEIPAVEIPGVDIPGVDIPGVDIPGVDIPGVESPGGTGIPNVQPNPIPNFNPAPNNPAPNNPAPVNPLSNDPAPNLGPLPAPVGPQTNIPVDSKVSHIVINRLQTRGIETDRLSGDDGLRVVVEPRNQDEVYLPQFGRMTVVVLDPQKSGAEARIARWDFDAASVRKSLMDSRTDKGIQLEMKWPNTPPSHSHLRLYVRLETETGERFEDDRELFIQLADRTTQWTPRVDDARYADSDADAAQSPRVRTADSSEFPPTHASPRTSQRPAWSPDRPRQ